ncbi:MAG: ribbon-helix-helix domain-containing protein [Algoriphagus sp.]|jgi:predicted transcriptional regulator|nr:ribbon-helix-helix domain-containing protein [Algoriphagus sp.]
MATFTSSLPDDVLKSLQEYSQKLSVPKNNLIEKALRLYFEHLKRAEYVQSYREAGQDEEIMLIAEEGMGTYLKQTEQ